MKTRLCIIAPLLLFVAIQAFAQSNPNEYRNLAAMHLWMNNCDKAQKCYNIYKELAGVSSEKMDVLIAQQCQGKHMSNYVISYDWTSLMDYIQSSELSDGELLVRVLSMYTDPEERAVQLGKCASVYESLARSLNGGGWYESILVQKKL